MSAKVKPLGTEKVSVASPVKNGDQYVVNGSGFAAGQALGILVEDGVTGGWILTTCDPAGAFYAWRWAQFVKAGEKTVTVYQSWDRKMTELARTTFVVVM